MTSCHELLLQAHALLRRISIFKTLQIISDAAAAAFSWFITGLQSFFAQGQLRQAGADSAGQLQLKPARQHVRQLSPLPFVSRSAVPAQRAVNDDLFEQELNVSQLRQRWHRQQEEHQRQAVDDPGARADGITWCGSELQGAKQLMQLLEQCCRLLLPAVWAQCVYEQPTTLSTANLDPNDACHSLFMK